MSPNHTHVFGVVTLGPPILLNSKGFARRLFRMHRCAFLFRAFGSRAALLSLSSPARQVVPSHSHEQIYSNLRNSASGPRAGFWPDSSRESFKIGAPAGLRPAGCLIFMFSDQNLSEIRAVSLISGPETLLHNIGGASSMGTA